MATKETKTLAESLLRIQTKLKAPKGLRNTFGNYSYRNTEGILEAVKPLLLEEGMTLKITDDLVYLGDRYYIKATAVVTKGGESDSVSAFAREEETKKGMDSSQISGSSSSYARKYALNGLFLIDDTKDADSDEYQANSKKNDSEPRPAPAPSKPYLNKGTEAYNKVVTALKDKKATVSQVLTKYRLSSEVKKELESLGA